MAVFWSATATHPALATRADIRHGTNVIYGSSRTIPFPSITPSPLFGRLEERADTRWLLTLLVTSGSIHSQTLPVGTIIRIASDSGGTPLEFTVTASNIQYIPLGNRQVFIWLNNTNDWSYGSGDLTLTFDDGRQFEFDPDAATVTLHGEVSATPVALYTAAATGGTGTVTYSIVGTPQQGISINSTTGVISFAATQTNIDALPDSGMSFDVTISAADDSGNTNNRFTLTVDVRDPDLIPMFDSSATVAAKTFDQNTAITPFTLPAATSGNPPLTYSISPALPAGLMLANRVVSGTPTGTLARTEFTWEVEDEDGDTDTLTFFIQVNEEDTAPTFGSSSVADQSFTRNAQIANLILPQATSGNAPITYSISPALPDGLSLTGRLGLTISGTPTALQASTRYTWTARDSDGDTDSITFNIAVVAPPVNDLNPTFGSSSVADKVYTENTAITAFSLPAATSGNTPLTYTLSPALPAGLTRNGREISGTPTAAAAQALYTWTVRDTDGDTDTLTFRITVNEETVAPPPPAGGGWREPRHWEGKQSDGDRADRLGEWDPSNGYGRKIAYNPNNNIYDLTFEWSEPLNETMPAIARTAGQMFVADGRNSIETLDLGSGVGRAYRAGGSTVMIEDADDVLLSAYPVTTENDLVVGGSNGVPIRLEAPTGSTEYLVTVISGTIGWRTRGGTVYTP